MHSEEPERPVRETSSCASTPGSHSMHSHPYSGSASLLQIACSMSSSLMNDFMVSMVLWFDFEFAGHQAREKDVALAGEVSILLQ